MQQQKKGAGLFSGVRKWIAGGALMGVAGFASAAVDTTAAVAQFTDVGTGVNAIGVAMLTAAIGGVAYKWITAYVL